jgi:hypothetical protein
MSTDIPDTERRPRPEGETMIQTEGIEKRSAGHAALQTVETIGTGAALTLGGLAAKDVYGKAKDALGSKGDANSSSDSKN